jgi:hypothetical protein
MPTASAGFENPRSRIFALRSLVRAPLVFVTPAGHLADVAADDEFSAQTMQERRQSHSFSK